MKLIIQFVAILFLQCIQSEKLQTSEKEIKIDVARRISKINENPAGVNACWLMDSEIKRPRKISFSEAMKDIGVKYIRFPYGHLADNYLWDADGDWGNKLTPKVATFSRPPGNWEWAVNQSSGEFIKAMDFDEYISICRNIGAEPMIVVNILSYKYENGPTYEQLKETAVQWVRYSNIMKKYNVKRWALGNEIDCHGDLISLEEYKLLYVDFARAMKETDPDIMIGPGLLDNWHADLLDYCPELIDFICVHNYFYKYEWRHQNYEGWKNTTEILVGNVEKCQQAVINSSIPDIEIHVTEVNSLPWKDNSDNNDLFRALALGEMLLNSIRFNNVIATYVWNTHGPWGGPNENQPYNILDLDNNREPRGEIMKIINENVLDYFLDVPRVNDFIRCYAMVNESNNALTVFLMNKNDQPEKVKLDISDTNLDTMYYYLEFSGKNPYDENPEITISDKNLKSSDDLLVDLPPVSLSILKFKILYMN